MLYRKLQKIKYTKSLNDVIFYSSSDGDILLEDTISSDEDISKEFSDYEYILHIKKIIEQLPKYEKEMIKLYFGLDNKESMSQVDIAKKYNISQSYASRIIKKTLKKIKNQLNE